MIKCPYCNTEVSDGAKFCYNCGNRLDQVDTNNANIEKTEDIENMTYKELEEKYQQKYFDEHAKLLIFLLIGGIVIGCIGGTLGSLYIFVSILGMIIYGIKALLNKKDVMKKIILVSKFSIAVCMFFIFILTAGIKGCFFSSDKPSEEGKSNTVTTEVKKEVAENKPEKKGTIETNVAGESKQETNQVPKWVSLSGRMYSGVWVYEGDTKTNEFEKFGQITKIDTKNNRIQFYRPVSKTYQWFERENILRYGGLYIKSDDPAYLKAIGK